MNTDREFRIAVKSSFILSAVLLVMLLPALPASAHIPLMAGGNENISSAMHITDPAKSWAVYGSLERNDVHYYSFDLDEGERIYLSLFKSSDAKEKNFLPALALIGPGLKTAEMPARQLSLPPQASGLKILAAEGKRAINATYEPFGPSSFIEIAEINISAPESARYYAAVYSNANVINNSINSINDLNGALGHYGLAVGYREEFSFSDRIATPLRLISVYLWEGQSLGMIFIPYLVAEILALLLFWRGSRRTSFCLAGSLAGFLFLATSASVFNQMVFSLTRAPFGAEVYITVAIAVFHAILGVAGIRLARGEAGILQRALLAVLGTLALLAGSGMIMGPILAMAASFLPSKSGSIFGKRTARAEEKD
ncbi:MAG: hypothetical protein PHW87_11955 [Methanothrix sp.]|nr:hypothetical protein [Methanothrix sp.]